MIRTILSRYVSSNFWSRGATFFFTIFPAFILAATALPACGGSTASGSDRTLAVTIEPQKYFIESIADKSVQVVALVPAGSNPEEYDPSPTVMKRLSEADAYFYIGGLGFEQRNLAAIRDNNPKLPLFEMGKALADAGSADLHGSCTDHSHTDLHAHDPHYWSSVVGAKALSRAAYDALVELYPNEKDKWDKGHDRLNGRIDSVKRLVDTMFANGKADKAFVIYHPSLSFFAQEFGLRQIVIEEDGKEPTAAHLRRVIDQARANGVRIVFIQPEFETRQAEDIAREIGARPIRINPLRSSWEEEILHIARALAHER